MKANWHKRLSWVLVIGVLGIPGAGRAAAQAVAINSANVQTMGPQAGDNGKNFLDIIGRGNTFSAAGPSFSVVDFLSGDLGLPPLNEVDSVTLTLTQSLFGAASRGPIAVYVSTDTATSIEGDGSSPLAFDASDPHGLNGQLSDLFLLGGFEFDIVRSGWTDTVTLPVDPTSDAGAYLVTQINARGVLRIILAPDVDDQDGELVGGAYAGAFNANTQILPTLSVTGQ